MGMFDYVQVECDLPPEAAELQCEAFQTKDFDNPYMDTYKITNDSRLVHEDYELYSVPEEERPYYGTPEWEGIGKFVGRQGRKPLGDRDVKFHGVLTFYTYKQETKEWWEFEAKFTDGKLVDIAIIDKPKVPA